MLSDSRTSFPARRGGPKRRGYHLYLLIEAHAVTGLWQRRVDVVQGGRFNVVVIVFIVIRRTKQYSRAAALVEVLLRVVQQRLPRRAFGVALPCPPAATEHFRVYVVSGVCRRLSGVGIPSSTIRGVVEGCKGVVSVRMRTAHRGRACAVKVIGGKGASNGRITLMAPAAYYMCRMVRPRLPITPEDR